MECLRKLVVESPYSLHDVETMLRIGFSPDQIRGAANVGLLLTPIIQNIMTIAALDGSIDELLGDHVSYIKRVKPRTKEKWWCYI